MRACGACFYYRPVDHEGGDCFNRPAHGYVYNHGEAENNPGMPNLEVIAIRPPVKKDDFCSFFSHKAQPKNQVGIDG